MLETNIEPNTIETPIEDLRVQLKRLKSDLVELAEFGKSEEDAGIYRMAFTEADWQSRQWLRCKMQDLGMAVRIDGAGNVIGHWPPDMDGASVIMGSHTDSVPCGGHLDGSLGVMTALECARVLIESETRPSRPIEVISFSDEEGRFGGMFGSQAFIGAITPETIASATDLQGVRLGDAMKARGLDPLEALEARRLAESIYAYLELHIEQGPVLDEMHQQVGVVDEITGLFRWSGKLKGKPNHAGTTPMSLRQDAFLGLAEFANEIPRLLEENGSDRSRATIGNVSLSPGSANTVPGLAEFSLDVRDTNEEKLQELTQAFRKALSAIARRRSLMFEFEEISRIDPVSCEPKLVEVIRNEAERLNFSYEVMPSGAAHDAQMVACSGAPVAMIFVPSKNGQSHSPAEWTAWQDIEIGANLMLHSILKLVEPE
ncbi:MAG: Zn-dependent hydrolase [Verrucomicrobiota bacterium]